MTLDKPTAFFEQHREEFVKEHHGKIVVIHDTEVAGYFESEREAYLFPIEKFEEGSFLLRRCLKANEEQPAVFHSRVA